jgi:hypothetical protein
MILKYLLSSEDHPKPYMTTIPTVINRATTTTEQYTERILIEVISS